jgi:predicted site-specific integrase-resolvase
MPSKSSVAKSAALSSSFDGLIRERACAKHLNISHRTLEEWRKKGKVPYLHITSRSIRYRLADVLQALRGNYGVEVQSTASATQKEVVP